MEGETTDLVISNEQPDWNNLVYLLEPSCLLLIFLASITVLAAAIRSIYYDIDNRKRGSPADKVVVDGKHAAMFPILASISLLCFFYFFSSIQFLLLLVICISTASAVAFVAAPFMSSLASRHAFLKHHVTFCGKSRGELGHVLCISLGIGVLLGWMTTGSYILHNILGISLCITFISYIKLENFKVCVYLLCALFFYDIFWVFISDKIFGSNVMMAAATKQADNPVSIVADALNIKTPSLLDLPVKLMIPPRLWNGDPSDPPLMLGLGDMALPGMLIALLLDYDLQKSRLTDDLNVNVGKILTSRRFWLDSYTLKSWIGYLVGMFIALGVSTVFQAAQPALLYLVPLVVIPALIKARRQGEFYELWHGLDYHDINVEDKDMV